MNNFCVYKHTSPNGKVYIGITKRNPLDRWRNGLGYSYNSHFFNAITKYGWDNFTHEILFSNLTKEEACDLEIELIAKYNSTNPNFGYNIATGGNLNDGFKGHHHSDESKQKISVKSKHLWENESYREIMRKVVSPENHPMKGRKQPSLTALNKSRVKAVDQFTINGEWVNCFTSIREAERQTNIRHGDISAACSGYRGTKTAGGYIWKYANEQEIG